jgi:choline dehydrogenase-like flavoprotein
VCVVGAGPAGIVTALALGTVGRRVVLLESGGVRSSTRAQQLNDGDHEGEPYNGLADTRHRQVGGTVNVWNVPLHGEAGVGAKYVPLTRRDLAEWPISWNDLEPYYRRAQALCGLGPLEYGADYWATVVRRPFRLDGTGLTSGVYQFGSAKQFTTILPSKLGNIDTIALVPSTTVVGLDVDRTTRHARAVHAVADDGQRVEVRARTVILACGAVENARLLLIAGLGGEGCSEWLGRGFMEHARDFSLLIVPDSPELFAEAAFYDQHLADGGLWIGGCLTLTDDALDSLRLPNAAMTLVPRRRAMRHRMIRRMLRPFGWSGGRYGWSRVRSPATAFDAFEVVLNFEHRPHRCNRIELSSRRDRFGNPLPRLFLRWTDEEQETLERLRDCISEWVRKAGLGRLQVIKGRRPDFNAHHHAGTTRMGLDSHTGVVDPQGRVFGLENLYLAGASIFPTAGYANPTLTIVATALRLAAHVDAALG